MDDKALLFNETIVNVCHTDMPNKYVSFNDKDPLGNVHQYSIIVPFYWLYHLKQRAT